LTRERNGTRAACAVAARGAPAGAMRFSRTTIGYTTASSRPNKAIAANAQRQPRCAATVPPRAMPSTEPNMPPAMKAPVSVARMCLGNTDNTTATPTLPYAASPTPTNKRAANICG
jgi:hypothetical protein